MPQFKVRNPNYAEEAKASFAKQTVMQTIGARVIDVQAGQVEIAFDYDQALTQQHDFIHAGIVSTVMDSACGYAAFTLMEEGAGVLTIEFKVNLLAPAKGETFKAIGRVRKAGRTITVTEAELVAYDDGKEKTVATMVATIMTMVGRDDVKG